MYGNIKVLRWLPMMQLWAWTPLQVGEVTCLGGVIRLSIIIILHVKFDHAYMIGGLTRYILPHLSGVPYPKQALKIKCRQLLIFKCLLKVNNIRWIKSHGLNWRFYPRNSLNHISVKISSKKYSRLPITRTFKGNRKQFELSGARRK